MCLAPWLLLSLSAAPPPVVTRASEAARALVGHIVGDGQAMEDLAALTDGLGPRLSGTEAYAHAAAWAEERFGGLGLAVRRESIRLAHGWRRGEASGRLLGPVPRALHVAAYGWSPPTPSTGLAAPVVPLTDITDEAIAAAGVKGAIVLVDRQAFIGAQAFHDDTLEAFTRLARYESFHRRLQAAGARAALVYTRAVNQVLRTSDPAENGEALALPFGSLGREDALLVLRQLRRGPVQVELHLDTTLSGPVTMDSVVAELEGRESPREVVMLGAHLDSWDFGTGAQDDGSGVVQVLEAARALAALPSRPRRTVRFALWASEEQGCNGSVGWLRAHAAELGGVVAYLNADNGAGRPKGWKGCGAAEVYRTLEPLAPVLTRLGGGDQAEDVPLQTDSGGFCVAGIPALDLEVADDDYDPILHHKPADTLDKVDPRELADGAAMLAVAAHAIADAPTRPAARLGRAEVEAFLRKHGAREYIRGSRLEALLPP